MLSGKLSDVSTACTEMNYDYEIWPVINLGMGNHSIFLPIPIIELEYCSKGGHYNLGH